MLIVFDMFALKRHEATVWCAQLEQNNTRPESVQGDVVASHLGNGQLDQTNQYPHDPYGPHRPNFLQNGQNDIIFDLVVSKLIEI